VAHERILFEEAMKSFDSNPMSAQTLLFPEVMEFSPDDFSVLLDVLTYLEKMGFRMSQFGDNTIMVEAIPSEMSWGNEKLIIREMLDNYLENQKEYSSFQEALAASFACKAAIKAGDVLNVDEMRELVNRLFGTKHPYYCPHGRPIIVQLSMEELDRRFERI
jgi:DNA mismatch repair protein MutL